MVEWEPGLAVDKARSRRIRPRGVPQGSAALESFTCASRSVGARREHRYSAARDPIRAHTVKAQSERRYGSKLPLPLAGASAFTRLLCTRATAIAALSA